MSGKSKDMSQIKQLLRMHQQKQGIKSIARTLCMSKNTVKSYLRKIEQVEFPVRELLKLDDPVLYSKFHPGNPSYKEVSYEYLKSNISYQGIR